MATTSADIASAAELERRRLAQQAAQARAGVQAQAQQAGAQTEAQAQQVITETESQTRAAKTQAQREAETRQAEIRKRRGQVEKEAQVAMGKARRARAIEQRKVVLPITKPRNLGVAAYIANVEAARKQAQRSGADATAAVTKVRDDYFREVDKARDKAISEIQKQKAGIISDIQTQLIDYNTELNKQLAELNSGVSVWEARSKNAIQKAQAEYEAAVKATLNRTGTDVFADMKDQGLIPTNAIYDSYDKTTGQLNYAIPDMRSGKEIFADLQAQNKIPPNADYKSYDGETGKVSYKVEIPNFGSSIFTRMQNAGTIPEDATFVSYNSTDRTVTYFASGVGTTTIPESTGVPGATGSGTKSVGASTTVTPAQNSTNVVGAAAGTAVMATMVITVGGGIAAVPTPPTWVIGGAIAAIGAAIAIYAERERIGAFFRNLIGKKEPPTTSTSQAADAVVTNNDGTAAYSIQQYTLSPQARGQTTTSVPLEQAKSVDIKDYLPDITPLDEKLILEQQRIEPGGIPMTKEPPVVMIRDPFNVPELQQKASNIATAAIGVAAVRADLDVLNKLMEVDKRTITAKEYRQLEYIRTTYIPVRHRVKPKADPFWYRGRTRGRRQYIPKDEVAEAAMEELHKLAQEDYLRKKAILKAARTTYVASLNPQPIKGKGSTDATAAAIGLWLAQDIIRGEIVKALNEGDSLETAMAKAQAKVKEMSQEIGLTQQQINAATATAVYQVALSNMAQEAVKAAAEAQTQGLTATQTQTQTLAATKAAAQTAVQTAVNTKTLTMTQAAQLAQTLDMVAEATATTTSKMNLPKLPRGAKEERRKKYPDGTIAWRMGETDGDVYKIIPPPYTMLKPITSKHPPRGMTRTKGTPQQTLTFIGDKVPFQNVSFDLGVTDGFIDVKSRKIKFTGGGRKTNVGTRIESTTRGVSLVHNPPRGSGRGKNRPLVSRGVYADKKNTRITRHRRRGWKRIY